jgi:hypothetical protein
MIAATMMVVVAMVMVMVMIIPLDSLLLPPPTANQDQISGGREPPWRGENSWERGTLPSPPSVSSLLALNHLDLLAVVGRGGRRKGGEERCQAKGQGWRTWESGGKTLYRYP